MFIAELNLRAYGPFSNKLLSFGTDIGLHLIFGANEAGKSTTLRALRNALFGMDDRDAHMHPADMLRVGLKIRMADGQLLNVERRKGKGLKSLIFPDSGKPVPVEEWMRVLPVSDADLFEQMFALDYERLIAGGKKLATFQGEVGQTILAASGDLGETIRRIQAHETRANEIYASQASSRMLNKAFREFKSAEARIRSERFTSQQYKTAVARVNELGQDLTRITGELTRATAECSRLTRLQTAAPLAELLALAEAELEALAGVAPLPQNFEREYTTITKRRSDAITQKRTAEKELNLVTLQLDSLHREPRVAALLPQIEHLKEQTGQIQKARIDIPKRQAELKEHKQGQQRLCIDWKLSPEALPQIAAEQRRRIDQLARQFLSLQSKREDAPRRISALESRRRDCELALAGLPVADDTSAIRQILKQIPPKRQSGTESQRLRQERKALRAELERDLATLPLWAGTANELEAIRVPLPASVSEFQTRFTKWQTLFEQAERDRERLLRDIEAREAALQNLECQSTIPTEDDLALARGRRDLGWKAVKETWLEGLGHEGTAASTFLQNETEPLPQAFEASIMSADSVADQLRLEAERVQKKRTAIAELGRIKTRIADQTKLLQDLQKDHAVLISEWQALWKNSGIRPRTPREMGDWVGQRKVLIEKLRDLRRLDGYLAEAEREERDWCDSLTQALHILPGQALGSLVGIAEARINEAESITRQRSDWEQSFREAQRSLESELEEQRANDDLFSAWTREWSKAIAGLPLSADSDPETAQDLIRIIGEVRAANESISKLQYRIDAIQKDETEYAGHVGALARGAARPHLASIDPLLAITDLHNLARTAYATELEFERLTKEKDRWQRNLTASVAEISDSETDLKNLLTGTGIADVGQVSDAIEKSKRKAELTKSIAENKRALAQAAGGTPLDGFLNEIRAVAPEARSIELSQLEQKIEQLDNEKADKVRELERVQSDFRLRQDATVVSDAAFEKYSAAARIDILLPEYVRNYLAAELLKKAVALYGDKHQDPLLKRTGEYFNELTCAAFSGILVEQERNGRSLKGVRRNGDRVGIEELSDGTRDQLFLALRLAYIENHCHANDPCPVILDDVLMAFDDQRAVAALRALRCLAKKTQVLIFTHSAHHVKLAQGLLGSSLKLHDLSPGLDLAA